MTGSEPSSMRPAGGDSIATMRCQRKAMRHGSIYDPAQGAVDRGLSRTAHQLANAFLSGFYGCKLGVLAAYAVPTDTMWRMRQQMRRFRFGRRQN